MSNATDQPTLRKPEPFINKVYVMLRAPGCKAVSFTVYGTTPKDLKKLLARALGESQPTNANKSAAAVS